MSATDELRRMLDERGVEWRDSSDENVLHTTWNDMNCWFNEFPDGWTAWGMAMRGTPEQAIAATLGSSNCSNNCTNSERTGTCHNAAPRYLDFLCSECGFVHYHSDENDSGDGNEWHYCPNCGARVVE